MMTKKSLARRDKNVGEGLIPSFHIEADGRGKSISLLISGVVGIKALSPLEILIATKREKIGISGNALELSVLEAKRVLINGRIDAISFFDRKKGVRL